jgi:hypothetical protein
VLPIGHQGSPTPAGGSIMTQQKFNKKIQCCSSHVLPIGHQGLPTPAGASIMIQHQQKSKIQQKY